MGDAQNLCAMTNPTIRINGPPTHLMFRKNWGINFDLRSKLITNSPKWKVWYLKMIHDSIFLSFKLGSWQPLKHIQIIWDQNCTRKLTLTANAYT